jgi:O-antigen/teichoic acid export membrane protein
MVTLNSREPLLNTAQLQGNLKERIVSSSLVMLVSQAFQFWLNLASIALLARILKPEDFGLIAMVTTIMGFLRVFSDAGLSAATVQREDITRDQVSNLFWANLAIGALATLLLATAAHAISWLYKEPRVAAVAIALSISFVLTASTVQHQALIRRQMRFGVLASIQVVSMTAGVATATVMALFNWSYWSLVGMQLSSTIMACFMTWCISAWRPSLPSTNSGIVPLLSFGAHLSASSLIWSLARGADALLIGRSSGPVALGLYSRAAALMLRPIDQLMLPVESVFVPALARVQNQPERYRHIFLSAFRLVALMFFVFTAIVLPLSQPITLLILGPQWEGAVPIFASFTLLALYTPIASAASWLLTSQGRGRDFLVSTAFGSVTTVVSFVIGLPYGPSGVALCFSVTSLFVNLPFLVQLCGRTGPVASKLLWKAVFAHAPIWGVVYVATATSALYLAGASLITQLLTSGGVGLVTAIASTYLYSPARQTAESAVEAIKEWKLAR